MKFIKLQKYLQVALILGSLALIWGCGSGGGSAPTVTIISSGTGDYVVQGDNLDSVGGTRLTINYDSSTLSSPTITQGGFISGAIMLSNTAVPGTIRLGIIDLNGFSGSGQIAIISFATVTGTGNVSIASVDMVNIEGVQIPVIIF